MPLNISPKILEELRPGLESELRSRYSVDNEEAHDIAEYIIFLIENKDSKDKVLEEILDVKEFPGDEGFINLVFDEIANIQRKHEQVGQVPVQHEASSTGGADPFVNQNQAPNYVPGPGPSIQTESGLSNISGAPPTDIHTKQRPTGPSTPAGPKRMTEREKLALRNKRFGNDSSIARTGSQTKGIGKSRPSDRGNVTRPPQATAKLEQLIASGNNGQDNVTKFVTRKPKGRCPRFPKCTVANCEFAHPTKECFAYPNCPNPPGTCNFLHPDQDQELIAKLEESNKEYMEQKKRYIELKQGSCKFGAKCAKENCPFAHPTPANPEAKIETLEFCPGGINCQDDECKKAHPRAPTAGVKPLPTLHEISLEQCKYGMNCTNYKCVRRHATSSVPCRAGIQCTRVDCTFNHPFKEMCRFGAACHIATCMYQHPEGRTMVPHTWTKDSADLSQNQVNERQFAVGEDQVMEQVAQQ
ncbi:NAB2 [Candida margitis]|uniref:NAB2 n=1 Tax=Candida margitis TaxID=1775924 RepID=UPI0022265371|nr:NAB2 [Candida margitis]KAI5961789.1 NAB2 [Candida margitis]